MQEYTSYHFDVVPSQLHGALDRFAQFFIAPLCKADALEREVQAVNNEFVGEELPFLPRPMLIRRRNLGFSTPVFPD